MNRKEFVILKSVFDGIWSGTRGLKHTVNVCSFLIQTEFFKNSYCQASNSNSKEETMLKMKASRSLTLAAPKLVDLPVIKCSSVPMNSRKENIVEKELCICDHEESVGDHKDKPPALVETIIISKSPNTTSKCSDSTESVSISIKEIGENFSSDQTSLIDHLKVLCNKLDDIKNDMEIVRSEFLTAKPSIAFIDSLSAINDAVKEEVEKNSSCIANLKSSCGSSDEFQHEPEEEIRDIKRVNSRAKLLTLAKENAEIIRKLNQAEGKIEKLKKERESVRKLNKKHESKIAKLLLEKGNEENKSKKQFGHYAKKLSETKQANAELRVKVKSMDEKIVQQKIYLKAFRKFYDSSKNKTDLDRGSHQQHLEDLRESNKKELELLGKTIEKHKEEMECKMSLVVKEQKQMYKNNFYADQEKCKRMLEDKMEETRKQNADVIARANYMESHYESLQDYIRNNFAYMADKWEAYQLEASSAEKLNSFSQTQSSSAQTEEENAVPLATSTGLTKISRLIYTYVQDKINPEMSYAGSEVLVIVLRSLRSLFTQFQVKVQSSSDNLCVIEA